MRPAEVVTFDFDVKSAGRLRVRSQPQLGVVLLALDKTTTFTEISLKNFPLFPLIPQFAVARVLPRGMWG